MLFASAAVCSAVCSSCAGCFVVFSFSSCNGVLRGEAVVSGALPTGLGMESSVPVSGGSLAVDVGVASVLEAPRLLEGCLEAR